MDIYKNKGKLSILFILIFLSLSNLNTCFLAKYLLTTIDEFMQNSREHLSLFYTHLVGILLFIVPLSTLYTTIVAIKRNTRITKDRQFILFTHLVYCFFVSHLLTFLFITLINVGFVRFTNNPISFLSISYHKYGEATHGKIYSLFYLSSAVFTTVNFLQYFIIGEFIFLMILFSRRARNIPVSMQIVNDFENSYVHHTIPSLILYTAFLIRLYYVTNGLVCMLTFVFYSNAVSYVSIMLSLMTYWMTHGAMLSPRRYNTVR